MRRLNRKVAVITGAGQGRRIGDAERGIGNAVLTLCSPDARDVTGQTITVNGGS